MPLFNSNQLCILIWSENAWNISRIKISTQQEEYGNHVFIYQNVRNLCAEFQGNARHVTCDSNRVNAIYMHVLLTDTSVISYSAKTNTKVSFY